MSGLMLHGKLNMPLPDEPQDCDVVTWVQFKAAAKEASDRIEELEANLAQSLVHLEWFISEDETNRGDDPMPERGNRTWDEINAYWIKHLDSAIAFVAEIKGDRDG